MKPLDVATKQALLAPMQASEVRIRTNPYVAAYVTARVVQTRLDEVLPWQWGFRLVGSGVLDANGVMHQDGILTIHGDDGLVLEFHDRGSAPPDQGRGQAKQAKHAVSDCFKRCAVHIGVFRYGYELQDVKNGRLPQASVEKALAAVGYHGPWDDRHYGPIGGIREADEEDDDVGIAPEIPVILEPLGDAAREQAALKTSLVETFGSDTKQTMGFLVWAVPEVKPPKLAAYTAEQARTARERLVVYRQQHPVDAAA